LELLQPVSGKFRRNGGPIGGGEPALLTGSQRHTLRKTMDLAERNLKILDSVGLERKGEQLWKRHRP